MRRHDTKSSSRKTAEAPGAANAPRSAIGDVMPESKDAGGALRMGTGITADPTALTTSQLLRENFWLRELIETRLNGMDKAISLLQGFADRTPTTMDVQHQVLALRETTIQRLNGIDAMFRERADLATKQERDAKEAVAAALSAAKNIADVQNRANEATNTKTEASFTKQIDNMDEKINDIKERITVIESKKLITDPSSQIAIAELKATVSRLSSSTDLSTGRGIGMTALWGLIVGGLGLLFGLGSFVAVMLKFAT